MLLSDLNKVADLLRLMPIGMKYKNSSGEYSPVPLDPTDNKLDGTLAFLTADSAKAVIQKQINEIDTTDKIDDPTVLAKIESMTKALDDEAKANATTN